MAYVPQNQDDEEKRRTEAGGGALGSFGSTQGAAAPTAPKFVNVADYLSKNTEGSANIANAAAGKLEQQRDEAGNAVNESGTGFNNAVSAGTTNLDENLLGSALSKPEDFVKDPNNTAKFMAMRDASYKGPMNLQGTDFFAPTESKVSGLKTTATGLGTEEGRNALVQSLSEHPTQGKTTLNQLLLQGNPESAKKIQDTAGTFKSVEDQWAQLLANAPSTADAAKAATEATRATTQSRLGDTTTGFKTGLSDKLTSATTDRDLFNRKYTELDNALANDTSGAGLREDQLKDLGIEGSYPYLSKLNQFNQGLNRYEGPVPLSTYVTNRGSANTNIPTLGGVANPEDYAREAALQQLSGQDLGLADTPENPYASNGALPGGIDYMGAFNAAGGNLSTDEANFLKNIASEYPQPGGDSSEFYSKYYDATGHQRTTEPAYRTNPNDPNDHNGPYGNINFGNTGSYDPANDFYKSPSAGAQPNSVPYPVPTSASPGPGYKWNQYLGFWLAPDNSAPPGTPGPGPNPGGPGVPRPGFGGV